MIYYFAYGSNMNHGQMKKRCGERGFKFIARAYLKGYRFIYDGYSEYRKGAVANIVKSRKGVVWGALYTIDEPCLKKLDAYENYPYTYDRREVEVFTEDGKKFVAWVYLREPRKPGTPSHKYRKTILEGARDCNLPEEYVREFL